MPGGTGDGIGALEPPWRERSDLRSLRGNRAIPAHGLVVSDAQKNSDRNLGVRGTGRCQRQKQSYESMWFHDFTQRVKKKKKNRLTGLFVEATVGDSPS